MADNNNKVDISIKPDSNDGFRARGKLPAYATEKTLKQILDLLRKMDKITEDRHKELVDTMEENHEEALKQAQEEAIQDKLRQDKQGADGDGPGYNKSLVDFLTGMGQASDAITGLAGLSVTLGVAFAGAALTITRSLIDSEFSQTLLDLSQSGFGLADTMSEGTDSLVISMATMGLTLDESAQMMRDHSMVFAQSGNQSINNMLTEFNRITQSGSTLGMRLSDANDALLGQLTSMRKMTVAREMSDEQQVKAATEQIRLQRRYSTVLGISAKDLSDFTADVIENNELFLATTMATNSGVLQAAQGFVTTMRAQGDAMGRLAETFMDAASMSAVGLSDSAVDLMAVFPEMGDELMEFQRQVQSGGLQGAEAGERFQELITQQLDALDDPAVFRRIQTIAELGGEGADTARMILQAKAEKGNAAKAMAKAAAMTDIDSGELQKNLQLFDAVMSQLGGSVDSIRMGIQASVAPAFARFSEILTTDLIPDDPETLVTPLTILTDSLRAISESVIRMLKALIGDTGDASPAETAERLAEMIQNVSEKVIGFFDGITASLNSLDGENDKFKNRLMSMLEKATPILGKLMWKAFVEAFKMSWPTIVKTVVAYLSLSVLGGLIKMGMIKLWKRVFGKGFWRGLGNVFSKGFSAFSTVAKFIGKGISKIFGPIMRVLGGAFTKLGKAIKPLLNFARTIPGLSLIFGLFGAGLRAIQTVVESVQSGAGIMTTIGRALRAAVGGFLEFLIGYPADLIKNIVAWVSEKLGFENVSEYLRSFSFAEAFQDFGTVIGNLVDGVKAIFGAVGRAAGAVWKVARAISAGLVAGLKAMKPWDGKSPTEEFLRAYNEVMDAESEGGSAGMLEAEPSSASVNADDEEESSGSRPLNVTQNRPMPSREERREQYQEARRRRRFYNSNPAQVTTTVPDEQVSVAGRDIEDSEPTSGTSQNTPDTPDNATARETGQAELERIRRSSLSDKDLQHAIADGIEKLIREQRRTNLVLNEILSNQ